MHPYTLYVFKNTANKIYTLTKSIIKTVQSSQQQMSQTNIFFLWDIKHTNTPIFIHTSAFSVKYKKNNLWWI